MLRLLEEFLVQQQVNHAHQPVEKHHLIAQSTRQLRRYEFPFKKMVITTLIIVNSYTPNLLFATLPSSDLSRLHITKESHK
jgi:hypothetical protein